MEISELGLGSFNAAHDLPAEMAGPVGQKHTKLDRRKALTKQGFLVGAAGGKVAGLLNGCHDPFVTSGLTWERLLRTRSTVPRDTPALSATICMVGFLFIMIPPVYVHVLLHGDGIFALGIL